MADTKKCSRCGATLMQDAPGGHCLLCLLQLGLEAAEDSSASPRLKHGDRVGRYELIEQLGEGGCGIVFLAEQTEPIRRRVALKVIKLGMDTQQLIHRFEAERQVLALMDHPNIARVFDAGATDTGRPFFVMELVRGVKITEYCNRNKLSTRQRLELFVQVCHALQHAHQKGIIHRDLKPSNILVTEDEKGALATPKIIDFGIAKSIAEPLTKKTVFTAFQQFMGTPAYMSPEQAGLGSRDVDTRSDIYSLGVLLYELLTGLAPFDAAVLQARAMDEVLRYIRETEPPRPSLRLTDLTPPELTDVAGARQTDPSKLPRLLRGDLDWIVMKCLEKDRARRYESASALGADLQHHLDNEPVTARPPGNMYRFKKFVQRNWLLFSAASVVLLTLIIGLAVSTWLFVREKEARHEAELATKEARSQGAKAREVAALLQNMLKSAGPSIALGRDATLLREIMDNSVARLSASLTNEPEVEAELHVTAAETYGELGNYDQMEQEALKALKLVRTAPGQASASIAKALEQVSDAMRRLGRLSDAEILSRETLAMRQKLFGIEHPEISISLNNLALVLREQGRAAEAEPLLRRSVAMDRKLFGNESLKVATGLDNLSSALWSQKKFAEAEADSREALALYRKLSDGLTPNVAIALNNLAVILLSEQKFAEAESLNRESVDLCRKLFGDAHPSFSRALANLAGVFAAQKRYVEAEALDREALAIDRKMLPRNHPDLPVRLENLAKDLVGLGRNIEADVLLREASELKK